MTGGRGVGMLEGKYARNPDSRRGNANIEFDCSCDSSGRGKEIE
jgi:hypothetical protein